MGLRDYQDEAVDAVYTKHKAGAKSLLLVAATGAGKTIMFSEIARRWNGRRLILAHRDELIQQACDKLLEWTGEHAGIEMGVQRSAPMDRTIVGSVQTLCRAQREIAGEPPSLIIVDEAHHAAADTYLSTIEKFNYELLLGVSATPWRGDKKDLSKVFEDVAYQISLIDLIRRGYLCDVRVEKLKVEIDISDAKVRAGEYNAADVGRAVDPYIAAIAEQLARSYGNRKIIAFCPTIETSAALAAALTWAGMPADHVDGQSPDRKDILARFSAGETRALCNCQLLTEGYDEPSIDLVFMLNPTASRTSYSQKMGRGTRLFEGKEGLLVLDPHFRSAHTVVGPQDIVAETEAEAKIIARFLAKGHTLLESYDLAQEKITELLRKKAEQEGSDLVSLARIAWIIGAPEIARYEPVMQWHSLPVSANQRTFLQRCGVPLAPIPDRGVASLVIEALVQRRQQGLATYKQAAWLAKSKIERHDRATFEDASAIISGHRLAS
jgi:superfamily II DNA or RNA helicase